MLHAATGTSDHPSPRRATEVALRVALEGLGGRPPSAAILLASLTDPEAPERPLSREAYERLVLAPLREALGDIPLAGGTTNGEIADGRFAEDSVSLLLLSSEDVRFSSALAEGLSSSPEAALRGALDRARSALPGEPRLILAFPDGPSSFALPIDRLLRRASGGLPALFGGCATGEPPSSCVQFGEGRAVSGGCAFLLASGNLRVRSGSAHGWLPLGERAIVEEAEGNRVARIGGETALSFYRRHLGSQLPEITFFALAVHGSREERFYLRNPIALEEETGAIRFSGEVPRGAEVRICEAGRDDILAAAARTAGTLRDAGRAECVLAFACRTRRRVLGTRISREAEILRETFGPGVRTFGFYGDGEIGPVLPGGPPRLHCDEFCLLALSSREEGPPPGPPSEGPRREERPAPEEPLGAEERIARLSRDLARARESAAASESLSDGRRNLLRYLNEELLRARAALIRQNEALRASSANLLKSLSRSQADRQRLEAEVEARRKVEEELRRALAALEVAATTDRLTGACNRQRFEERLRTAMTEADRTGNSFCLAMLDLDRFKRVNDFSGHLAGDVVLSSVAALLRQELREGEVLGRWGGEEFLLLLPGGPERGTRRCEHFRASIEALRFDLCPPVTASFGLAAYRAGETSEELVHRADSLLYQAKRNGRNRVEVERSGSIPRFLGAPPEGTEPEPDLSPAPPDPRTP